MELSQDQFFKGVYNYRTEANGPVHTVPRFSYESGARLYDVIQFPFGTVYQVNGTSHLSSSPIHREILKHYSEQHVEWRYNEPSETSAGVPTGGRVSADGVACRPHTKPGAPSQSQGQE